MDKKLVEITCKYSDGTSKILDGRELEKFMVLVQDIINNKLEKNFPIHNVKWYNLGKEKHY